MDILPHPNCTRRFGPPLGWDEARDGPCGTLEIADIVDPTSARPAMESLWRPGPAELELLNRGGALVLVIHGQVHPVVALGVTGAERLAVSDEVIF